MKIREIRAVESNNRIKGKFCAQIRAISERVTNFGNPYFEVEFVDHEDRLMLRVWDNTNVFNEIRNLQEGEFVEVSGEFSNNPRFGIEGTNWSVRRLEESERKEFLVGSEDRVKGISEDFKFIEGEVKKIRDPRYRELATKFLENYGEEFRRAAAAHSVHHAYRGGLVEHVAHVMKAARRLLEEYRWLNSDLLITGILFHDCGKIVECCPRKEELRISQNLAGELLGHISIGIEIVNRLWKELKLDECKDVSPNNHLARVYLLHLIASHHGALEYGSPVMPKIPEAYVLHYLDNMDAKLEIFREIYERETSNEEGLYGKNRILGVSPAKALPRFHDGWEPSNVIELLQWMVKKDTTNGRISGENSAEIEMMEGLASFARKWGLRYKFLDVEEEGYCSKNLLIYAGERLEGEWFLLESHIDTVSGEGVGGLAYRGEVNGGQLIGRGSCDTKSSGAAMFWALRELAQSGKVKRPVGLLFTVDEEIGKAGIISFCKLLIKNEIKKPKYAIVGEPTCLKVVVAHNGSLRFLIRAFGEAAHSSKPEHGKSAIGVMMDFLRYFEEDYVKPLRGEDKLTGRTRCSVTMIQGGVQVNMVPAECEVWVDRRILPSEKKEEVEKEVEEVISKYSKREGGRVEIIERCYDPPLKEVNNVEFSSILERAFKEQGLSYERVGAAFGTDASNLAIVGVGTVVLGPGDIRFAHTNDERVDLEEVERGVSLYLEILKQWMMGEG